MLSTSYGRPFWRLNKYPYRINPDTEIHPKIKDAINAGKNIFLSGGGGVGKSWTIDKIKKNATVPIAVTATTGIAAMNIGGCTVHSFTGIGIRSDIEALDSITGHYNWRFLCDKLCDTEILVIDEISMLYCKPLALIDAVCREARLLLNGGNKPFGGLQVIVSGDFFQLPPVIKNKLEAREAKKAKRFWAFQSPVWESADFHVFNMSKVYRQESPEFVQMLQRIRKGTYTDGDYQTLLSRTNAPYPDGIDRLTRFVATNAEAAKIHEEVLETWDDEEFRSVAEVKVSPQFEKWEDSIRESTIESCIAEGDLRIKKGMQVICLVNDPDGEYVNGSLGTFLGQKESLDLLGELDEHLEVLIHRTNQIVRIAKHTWEHRASDDCVKATLTQYPVKLAYALSIHKAQGMTLDYADVDMKRVWEDGQAYVAFSRVRTLEGLFIRNLNMKMIKANEDVLEYYSGFGV